MSNNLLQGPSPDGPRARTVRGRRRAGSLAALVAVALHGAVLWLLASNIGSRAPWRPPWTPGAVVRAGPEPMTWVTAVPPAVPPPADAPAPPANPPGPDRPAPAPRAAGTNPSAPRAPRSAPVPVPVPGVAESSMPLEPTPAIVPADAVPSGAPSPDASPAPATVPLRRTLRKDALRELSAGGRAWRDDPRLAPEPPAAVDSRLASGMAAAAKGDCLRGEFDGGDMGLLSLPMMGLAAARGRCRLP